VTKLTSACKWGIIFERSGALNMIGELERIEEENE
jgi:hypothetical protein